MSDRRLRDPDRANAQLLEGMLRKIEVLRSRSFSGVARTAREPGVWWQTGALGDVSVRVPSGFWICYIQGTFVGYNTAGTRIGIGVGVAPTSTGIVSVGTSDDWPLAAEYINWTPATDGLGAQIPTERTLSAVGWIEMDEEFLVALNVAVVGTPTYPSWYNGRIIMLPH